MPRAATTKAVDQEEGAMALLEKEVTRFAESLDDYEHVLVVDIGGWAAHGFWLVVHDHRSDLDYEIASCCECQDFIGADRPPALRFLAKGKVIARFIGGG
jgi:hypothetical protein